MKKHLIALIPLLAVAAAAQFPALSGLAANPYTFVLMNGHVHANGAADAVAISGTKIAAVGSSAKLKALCQAPCRVLDAKGGFISPGFHDAHAHQISGGAQYFRVKVSGSSVDSIVRTVREFAKANPTREWIIGRGWNAAGFGTRFPTRQDLDRAEAKRPVVLLDSDGHQVWANSAAIIAAGVNRETADPEGGTIVRDANGEPQGVFLENAVDLIYAKVPSAKLEERQTWILKGDDVGIEAGFTTTQGGPVGLETMEAYQLLDQDGRLKQRAFLWASLEADDEAFEKIIAFDRALPKNGKVKVVAFKGFVDGVISSYTAALLAPYHDHSDTRGEPAFTQDQLDKLVLRANRAGYPVALHAIGDRAVRMALDAFEKSRNELNHSIVNRVEHIESLDPSDAPRFAKLNVAASMQPSHYYFGSGASSYYPRRLGPVRIRHAFAWNELHSAGALLLFGTDYPVVDQDPIEGMFCATQRVHGDGTPFELHQRVDAETAFSAFTQTPAKAIGMGNTLGKLQPGFEADLVVFAQDPRLSQAKELSGNPVRQVIVGGKLVKE